MGDKHIDMDQCSYSVLRFRAGRIPAAKGIVMVAPLFFQARAKTSSSKEKAYTWKHLKWVEVVRVYFCWSHGLIVSVVCASHLRRFHVGPVLWLADKRPHTDNICPSWLMFYAWGREFLKRGKKKRKRGRFHSEKVQKHEEFHEMSPQVDGKTNDTQAARMLLSLWSMGAKISCCHQSLHICCKEVYLNIIMNGGSGI